MGEVPPGDGRLLLHLRVVAVLHIVAGTLAALTALAVLGLALLRPDTLRTLASWAQLPPPLLGLVLFGGVPLFAVLALGGGTLLLRRSSAARIPVAIVSSLSLLNFPFGMAFGAYSLVVVLNRRTDRLWLDALPEGEGT